MYFEDNNNCGEISHKNLNNAFEFVNTTKKEEVAVAQQSSNEQKTTEN